MNPHRFGASYHVSIQLSERIEVYVTGCIAVIFGQRFAG